VVGTVAIVLLSGCAGYRVGATNPELTGGKTVQVAYFQNETLQPRLSESLNQAFRRSLQQDGSLKLETSRDSDLLIKGVINDYLRNGISYRPDDVRTSLDYEVRIDATITVIERLTGRVLLEDTVVGRTSVRGGPDMVSAERQALPMLAEDWARRATSRVVEGPWW